MKIFELIKNKKFFKPLTSCKRQFYCDCMDRLITAVTEMPVLYEPDAKEIIKIYLKETGFEGDLNVEARDTMATMIDCGWIEKPEVGRSTVYTTTLSGNAVKLNRFLHELTESTMLSANDIFSLYDSAKYLTIPQQSRRYYDHILIEMQRRILNLREALVTLKSNVKYIIRDVIERHTLDELMVYMSGEYMETVFREYFYIKRGGFTNQYFSDIIKNLREFESDDEKVMIAAAQYNEKKEPDDITPEEHIRRITSQMISFLSYEFNDHMEAIETKINQCWETLYMRLTIAITSGKEQMSLLNDIFEAMKRLPESENEQIIEKIGESLNIYQQEYISPSSFELIRRAKVSSKKAAFEESSVSDDEVREMTKKIKENHTTITRENAKKYIRHRMKGKNTYVPVAEDIQSKEEGLYLAIITAMGSDHNGEYEVSLTGETVENEHIRFSGIKITKKEEEKTWP